MKKLKQLTNNLIGITQRVPPAPNLHSSPLTWNFRALNHSNTRVP